MSEPAETAGVRGEEQGGDSEPVRAPRVWLCGRFELVLDPGTFQELDADLTPQDPLGFVDAKKYRDRLKSTYKSSGLRDAFSRRKRPN